MLALLWTDSVKCLANLEIQQIPSSCQPHRSGTIQADKLAPKFWAAGSSDDVVSSE